MAMWLEAGRLLVMRAASLLDDGAGSRRASAMAKLYATEAAQRIVDEAVQIHGGLGVTRGQTVERLYREVRALRIYEGTSEIQRSIIAHSLLKEPA
jgi:acyl-CoA dehydrogenase